MPFNGSGLFARIYSWVADRNAAVKIQASRMDAEMDGMATGLSNCVTKDGQTTTSAIIPFAAGIRVSAAAPASPANGDLWITTGGLFSRIDGRTVTMPGELVESGTKSGSASYAFDLPTGFSAFEIDIYDLVVTTSGDTVFFEVSTDNAANWKGSNYAYVLHGLDTTAATNTSAGSAASQASVAFDVSSSKTGMIRLFIPNPAGTTLRKPVKVESAWYVHTTSRWATFQGMAVWDGGNDAITDVRLRSSATTNLAFGYRVRGLR